MNVFPQPQDTGSAGSTGGHPAQSVYANRAELIEAALGALPLPVLVLDPEERVVFWNRAAELLTGCPGADLVGRPLGPGLALLGHGSYALHGEPVPNPPCGNSSPVHLQPGNGLDVPVTVSVTVLRDGLGRRIGKASLFHPAEHGSVLPRGECLSGIGSAGQVVDIEERLELAFDEFQRSAVPLAILWIAVDQAHDLRQSHGSRACETMLSVIESTLANALRPEETIGRWGDGEFLVLSREPIALKLDAHARALATMARTADFRWWGDRIPLTLSIGSAVAIAGELLEQLLKRAQAAMLAALCAGGNRTISGAGDTPCSQS